MPKRFYTVLLLLCFLGSACATFSSDARRAQADGIALRAGFQKMTVKTDPFLLTAYARLSEPGKSVHMYIEGDGYAWVTPSRPSGDPTPRNAVALQLAVKDPAANVVYLARPCQFTPMEQNPACEEFYWTNGRFSNEVVKSINQAVSYFVQQGKAPEVDLIGYSGGAAIAILVAARRNDIQSLRTVAGNLDPEVVNQYHGASSLDGSLNPAEIANKIASIPQIHFIGGEDDVIPFSAVSSYLKKMGDKRCFQTKTLPEATHTKGWDEQWVSLLTLPVSCREN
jgi:hypothetical protein